GGPVVTAGAAVVDEDLQALLLSVAQGSQVAFEVVIEARGCRQRALESADGVGDVGVGERFFEVRIGGGEQVDVGRYRGDTGDGVLRAGRAHLDRVEDRSLRLRFDVCRATVPELGVVESGVHDGRGVTRT